MTPPLHTATQAGNAISVARFKHMIFTIDSATRKLIKSQLTNFRQLRVFQKVHAEMGPTKMAEHIAEQFRMPLHVGT